MSSSWFTPLRSDTRANCPEASAVPIDSGRTAGQRHQDWRTAEGTDEGIDRQIPKTLSRWSGQPGSTQKTHVSFGRSQRLWFRRMIALDNCLWNSPWPPGETIRASTESLPADWPARVTLLGSPPN